MKVALFIPCYINQLYPNVALATLKILEHLGYEVEYPPNQSCCGQPFLNNGLIDEAKEFAKNFIETFSGYDYIVSPGSSCVSSIRFRYEDILDSSLLKLKYKEIESSIFELFEFLHDIVGLENLHFSKPYPKRVGLHESCHGLRELNLGVSSELIKPKYSKIEAVLNKIEGLEIVRTKRDECCGFGGTFSIFEEAVSVQMGRDRIDEHISNGIDTIVGIDSSCLMHMSAISQREGRGVEFIHASEILAEVL